MNSQSIHDALNMIDDDMLDEVYNLRCRKKINRITINIISVAACICLIAISLSSLKFFISNDSVKGNEPGGVTEEYTSKDKGETFFGGIGGIDGGNEFPTLIVEIKHWKKNGFTGKIYKIVDSTKWDAGETVTVQFNGDMIVAEATPNGYIYEKRMATKEEFPQGSLVKIEVTRFNNKTIYTSKISEWEEN